MGIEHLETYLNDHLAGSVVALELLTHLEKEYFQRRVGCLAVSLKAEIGADRRELEVLMERHNERLQRRAEEQRQQLEAVRLEAANAALG